MITNREHLTASQNDGVVAINVRKVMKCPSYLIPIFSKESNHQLFYSIELIKKLKKG